MQARKNFSEFVLSREKNAEKTAKYIFLGVPEENGSDGYSLYAGSSKGPKAVRAASHSFCSYAREEGGIFKKFIANSFSPVDENRFPLSDIGDKKTTDVATTVEKLITNNQFPIVVGGDHSITYEILKGINNKVKSFNVVYFDAHPDFLPSGTIRRKSYATVMYDASLLSHIDIKHSVQVGLRDYENEEFVSTEKSGINIFSTLDVERLGAVKIANKIKQIIGKGPTYISLDMDVLDMFSAPSVSTPSPCGLTGREILNILSELSKENIIGIDLVEITPKNDEDLYTAAMGAKLLIEFLVRHNNYH